MPWVCSVRTCCWGAYQVVPARRLTVIMPGEAHSPRDPDDQAEVSAHLVLYVSPEAIGSAAPNIAAAAAPTATMASSTSGARQRQGAPGASKAVPVHQHVEELVEAEKDGRHGEPDAQQPEGLIRRVVLEAVHRSDGGVGPRNATRCQAGCLPTITDTRLYFRFAPRF